MFIPHIHRGCCPSKLIYIAYKEIGYRAKRSKDPQYLYEKTGPNDATDGSHDWNKYAEYLSEAGYYQKGSNKNGFDWCTIFVDWCFYRLCSGDKDKAYKMQYVTDDLGAGVSYSKRHYEKAGQLYTDPMPGDEIFFGTSHTGIVFKVDDSYVYTIEGNTSQGVYARKYPLSTKGLTYGRPKYEVPESNPSIPEIEIGVTSSGNWGEDESYLYAMYGFTTLPKEYLSHENLYPYIVTIDRNTKLTEDLDNLQTDLRTQKVCGGVIEAGYLYDSMYIKREFKSPRFYEQIHAFDEMDIPYGLWMTCRARTEAEAKAEMAELRKCIQVSKLNLGVWLDLKFSANRTTTQNDEIINIYKKLLADMGLSGKIGLYVTPEQLKTITWADHQNEWLLWLVDRLQYNADLEVLDALLIPDFWNVDRQFELDDQTLDVETVGITFGKAYPFPVFSEETVEV